MHSSAPNSEGKIKSQWLRYVAYSDCTVFVGLISGSKRFLLLYHVNVLPASGSAAPPSTSQGFHMQNGAIAQ